MILDFRAKGYHCNYYAGKKFYNHVCFSRGCYDGIVGRYAYITYIWPKKIQKELNYCFFDINTLSAYFLNISKLLGFYLISLTETEKEYKLQIKCIPNKRYFIYVSMCIRYVYEYPFSLLLYAAWQNKDNFSELNIIQIMQYYLALFHNGRRCHCPGESYLAFSNINAKWQFSLIRDNFNCHKSFVKIFSKYNDLTYLLNRFNIKQLPQIISGINFIANSQYAKHKKNICRW